MELPVGSGHDLGDTRVDHPVTASDLVFDGMIWGVRRETVDLGAAGPVSREFVDHTGAVVVVALREIDGVDHIVLIRQYRHPVRTLEWELPAGLLDVPGEDPAAAAARELAEEAHVAASDWRVLVDPFTSPGMTTEAIRVYLARGLSAAPGERFVGPAEEADMPVARVPLAELVDGVLAGHLHNPSLVTGVLAASAARARGGWDALRRPDAPWPVWPVPPVAPGRPTG